jgi:hypothetical protein
MPDIEDEVVATALEERLVHPYAELYCSVSDRSFGDGSLLVGRELHDQKFSLPIGQR